MTTRWTRQRACIGGIAWIVCAAACAHSDNRSADSIAAIGLPRFSLADFGKIRWIEGQWRGKLPDGTWFYNGFHFVDDSTLVTASFDSTFTKGRDSATVALRAGAVFDRATGGAPGSAWHATRIDASGASFSPSDSGGGHFGWQRDSADRWTAVIITMHGPREQRTVYSMERAKR